MTGFSSIACIVSLVALGGAALQLHTQNTRLESLSAELQTARASLNDLRGAVELGARMNERLNALLCDRQKTMNKALRRHNARRSKIEEVISHDNESRTWWDARLPAALCSMRATSGNENRSSQAAAAGCADDSH